MVAKPGGIRCTETYKAEVVMFDACGVLAPHGAGPGDDFADRTHSSADGDRLLGAALHARLAELGWVSG